MQHVKTRLSAPIPGPLAAAVVFTLTGALGAEARADVTIEQRMSVSGPVRLANMTGTTITSISGDRSRTQTQLRMDSALMRTLARGAGESIEIVSLGEDRIWSVDPARKTYTETTFTAQRAALQKNIEAMREAQASQQQGASGVDESSCEWLPPESDVKRTGAQQSIAGYRAEQIVVTGSQACRDRQTSQTCQFTLTLDQWIAPDFSEAEETLDFQRAYAEKLGLSAGASRDVAEQAEAMFGRYEGIWKAIGSSMQEVDGYPVKTSFALAVGGPECETARSAGTQETRPSVGALAQGALGGLGGLLNRGRRNQQPEPQEETAAAPSGSDSMVNLMTITSELVSVRTDPVPAEHFQVPTGFRQVAE